MSLYKFGDCFDISYKNNHKIKNELLLYKLYENEYKLNKKGFHFKCLLHNSFCANNSFYLLLASISFICQGRFLHQSINDLIL